MAWLTEIGGRTRLIRLQPPGALRFGRAEGNDVVIDDLKVSRLHAELICRNGTWCARDCGSRNGVFVNGLAQTDVELNEGDTIRIGPTEWVFTCGDDPLATLDDSSERAAAPAPVLSPREKEVLVWVASGATDFQIARRLGIGLTTVHSHLDRIREKTGRRRRPDLTRLASEMGLRIPEVGGS